MLIGATVGVPVNPQDPVNVRGILAEILNAAAHRSELLFASSVDRRFRRKKIRRTGNTKRSHDAECPSGSENLAQPAAKNRAVDNEPASRLVHAGKVRRLPRFDDWPLLLLDIGFREIERCGDCCDSCSRNARAAR